MTLQLQHEYSQAIDVGNVRDCLEVLFRMCLLSTVLGELVKGQVKQNCHPTMWA